MKPIPIGVIYLLIGVSLLAAFVIDRFLMPPGYVVSSLYAIPILLAIPRSPSRVVAGVSLVALTFNLLSIYLDRIPLGVWAFSLFGLLLIASLAEWLALQRQAAVRHTREAEEARHQLQQFLGMVSHDLAQPLTTIQGYMLSSSAGRPRCCSRSTSSGPKRRSKLPSSRCSA